jgi:hypothetical protein
VKAFGCFETRTLPLWINLVSGCKPQRGQYFTTTVYPSFFEGRLGVFDQDKTCDGVLYEVVISICGEIMIEHPHFAEIFAFLITF